MYTVVLTGLVDAQFSRTVGIQKYFYGVIDFLLYWWTKVLVPTFELIGPSIIPQKMSA